MLKPRFSRTGWTGPTKRFRGSTRRFWICSRSSARAQERLSNAEAERGAIEQCLHEATELLQAREESEKADAVDLPARKDTAAASTMGDAMFQHVLERAMGKGYVLAPSFIAGQQARPVAATVSIAPMQQSFTGAPSTPQQSDVPTQHFSLPAPTASPLTPTQVVVTPPTPPPSGVDIGIVSDSDYSSTNRALSATRSAAQSGDEPNGRERSKERVRRQDASSRRPQALGGARPPK